MWEHDNQVQSHALLMWANHIETGCVTMSATDARNCGREMQLNILEPSQVKFVERLRALAKAQLMSQSACAHEEPAQAQVSANPAPSTLQHSWTMEKGVWVCRVGRVKVADISCVLGLEGDEVYVGTGFMPAIATELGLHPCLEDAQKYIERAVTAWTAALSGIRS